ncbi:MAG: signal peptide peptidase SppA [Nitrospiraceae bacterium]|nr:signal peptide peptidase SppA [Nitrospiraceae bacterium]
MKKKIFLLMPLFLMLASCANINLSLFPQAKPLKEKLIEGEGRPKILLLDLDGVISFGEKKTYLGAGSPSPVEYFSEALRKAEEDKDIAGVIIRINSPGGGVTASDTIYHEIERFKRKKKVPVYAYIMDVGASGGYYAASAADRIIASPTALTGSIGVIAMKLNIEGLMSKVGVREETYKSGPVKDFWSPFRPSTPQEKAMLQGIIESLYGRFTDAVYKSRRKELSRQQVLALADGRIFTADQALKEKLIDREAYLDEAINGLKKSLEIKKARVVTYARPGQFKQTIYSEAPGSVRTQNIVNINLISVEGITPEPGVTFMYLWNP